MDDFCQWNEQNSTKLIIDLDDISHWQKSLQLMKSIRNMVENYMNDCLKPDIYEKQTKLLFKCTRSDPCCLLPKTVNLQRWHIRYFKHFKVMATMNNYLSLLERKMKKLQCPQENIDSKLNKIPINGVNDNNVNKKHQYATRHQKISLFEQIKHEIIVMILTLTQTINGCYILCEDEKALHGVFCGLDQEISSSSSEKKTQENNSNNNNNHNIKNGMDIDGEDEKANNRQKAQLFSYYGTPRLSQLLDDSQNNVMFYIYYII